MFPVNYYNNVHYIDCSTCLVVIDDMMTYTPKRTVRDPTHLQR